jgi:hypothetical protein
MKTIVNFFVVLLILANLTGCAAFFDESETASGMARISLSAASNSAARSVAGDLVPLADATRYDNTYTAVFKESGGQVHTFDFASIDSPRIFDIPSGTYDILVMAGYTPAASTSKYLLGSGFVKSKALASGNNPVTVTLLSIDLACFLIPSVPSGGNLVGTIQLDLRNPLLSIGMVNGLFDSNSFTSTAVGGGAYTLNATAPTLQIGTLTGNYDALITIGFAGANNLSLPSGWCVSDSSISTNDPYTKRFIKTVTVGLYTITGIVTAGDTGNPVMGATVELYNNGTLEATDSTGADGRYVFGNVADGFSGTVKVNKNGYQNASDGLNTGNNQVNWWNSDSTNGNFELIPAP